MTQRTAVWAVTAIIVVTLGFSTYAAVAAYRTSHVNADIARAVKAQTDARFRAVKVADYSACLSKNDARGRIRRLVGDELAIIVGGRTLTPAERALGDAVTNRGLQIYPNVSCVPLRPAHLTSAEKASLFHAEPIPPLIVPLTKEAP